jgi:hypothetical protein
MSKKRASSQIKAVNSRFSPDRCKFYVETNDLIDNKTINLILINFSDDVINRLNDILKGSSFIIGADEKKKTTKGVLRYYPTHEFDFRNSVLTFYLSKIFILGYGSWTSLTYGSLKRYIWESFFHEVIMSLMNMMRLDTSLVDKAKEYYFGPRSPRAKEFVGQLFNKKEDNLPKVNYFMLMTKLWNENLPTLGFFDVLYRAKIKELKKRKAQIIANINVVRILNEIRRNALNYEYEYNLSELVNYVLNKDQFKIYYKHDLSNRNNLYAKARRVILKFIKEYDIELKAYKDSAKRTHLFLTHKTFEKIKSACFQLCLLNVNRKAMEEYEKFSSFYAKCPICKEANINRKMCEILYFSSKYNYFRDLLIERTNGANSFEEINNKENYFGIPCEDCFSITKNIQGKYQELNEIQEFILKYNRCPICNAKNHNTYLSSFYYDETKKEIRNYLIKSTITQKNQLFKVNMGIPCCVCYTKIFGEDPPAFNFR